LRGPGWAVELWCFQDGIGRRLLQGEPTLKLVTRWFLTAAAEAPHRPRRVYAVLCQKAGCLREWHGLEPPGSLAADAAGQLKSELLALHERLRRSLGGVTRWSGG
jgi:hypothetical protein